MQMTDNHIFLDTNILVYANLALSPFHLQATERLQTLTERRIELWLSRQTFREYLAAIVNVVSFDPIAGQLGLFQALAILPKQLAMGC